MSFARTPQLKYRSSKMLGPHFQHTKLFHLPRALTTWTYSFNNRLSNPKVRHEWSKASTVWSEIWRRTVGIRSTFRYLFCCGHPWYKVQYCTNKLYKVSQCKFATKRMKWSDIVLRISLSLPLTQVCSYRSFGSLAGCVHWADLILVENYSKDYFPWLYQRILFIIYV